MIEELSANPTVTVGLCVKNAERKVKIAFDSISKQDFPHETVQLIIVDDGSSDKTLNVLKGFASKTKIRTTIFSSGGKGLGVSRQIVVDNAQGDYIVWVDDDLVLNKNLVRTHVELMEKDRKVGAARANQMPTRQTLISILESISTLLATPYPKAVGTGGSIFRLKAVQQIGGFDIRIKGAGEDQDISYRLKTSGWLILNNASTEFHHKYPPTTLKSVWHRHSWYGYGNHFLFHKYKTYRLYWDLFFPSFLWEGFKVSLQVYSHTHEKKVFFLIPYYFYRGAARFHGFLHAHLDGYGHLSTAKVGSIDINRDYSEVS